MVHSLIKGYRGLSGFHETLHVEKNPEMLPPQAPRPIPPPSSPPHPPPPKKVLAGKSVARGPLDFTCFAQEPPRRIMRGGSGFEGFGLSGTLLNRVYSACQSATLVILQCCIHPPQARNSWVSISRMYNLVRFGVKSPAFESIDSADQAIRYQTRRLNRRPKSDLGKNRE